ncbi:MAG: oxidoreductase [Clostridiales bacterium]|nr:aldo/keto reductase [Clostridiales bacterium]PWM40294.1 MAG: oxidoreductase [Clostridiales bacterium]
MIYRNFQNLKLSALGMGAMRLPVIDGDDTRVDQELVNKMVACAMEGGVNYYDTAWGYHGGQSELAMGRALAAYPRESFYLADKFPGYDLSNMDKVEEIFEKQLEKCGVEYFDFYLIHNVCELNIEEYLNPAHRIYDYLTAQKKNGRIRHLGFSAHGSRAVIERFLSVYGDAMEFCQLQINYLDWNFQDAKGKVALLRGRGLPVWVMEPVRGGSLASLKPEYEERLRALRPDEAIPAWAFRFLQSIPEVTVTLSGMSNLEQMQQNIATFGEEKPLSVQEMDALLGIADEMVKKIALPCTACRYCTTHCPQGLDIPHLLALYNEHAYSNGGFIAPMAVSAIEEDKRPNACIGCRSCEAVCPQQIKISEAMADFSRMLGL